jgi:Fe-S-cluster-containing hydrogenase component 2
MIAHYGYEDGAGRFYLTVDTGRCTGCGECVPACGAGVLEMIEEDPVEERMVAAVAEAHRRQLRDSCAPCKPAGDGPLPCVAACPPAAISHSW